MHTLLPLLLVLLNIFLLSLVAATALYKRATINCAGPTAGLSLTCWFMLNLTGYMHSWDSKQAATGGAGSASIEGKKKNKKKRAPAATTAATTVQGFSDNQSWSSCFMQQATGPVVRIVQR